MRPEKIAIKSMHSDCFLRTKSHDAISQKSTDLGITQPQILL